MLDEKDLQAIAQLLSAQKTEIMGEVQVLMESQFQPQFNLLADSLANINDKLQALPNPDLLEELQDELDMHHEMLKLHSKEISKLKKAN